MVFFVKKRMKAGDFFVLKSSEKVSTCLFYLEVAWSFWFEEFLLSVRFILFV